MDRFVVPKISDWMWPTPSSVSQSTPKRANGIMAARPKTTPRTVSTR